MSRTKDSTERGKQNNDETVADLMLILKTHGIVPTPELLNDLREYWVMSTSAAQTRGMDIALMVKQRVRDELEKDELP